MDKLDRKLIQLKIEREALKKETDEATKKRLILLESEIAKLQKNTPTSTRSGRWRRPRFTAPNTSRSARPRTPRARDGAPCGDLARMSELQYGRIPELEKQLATAAAQQAKATTLLRTAVTENEIAEVVSRWTGIPCPRCWKANATSCCAWKRN